MSSQPEDADLLRRYAEDKSEPAFAELVRRHINLVYASALRRVGGDAHLAEDVTQQVFTALAGNAKAVADRSVLAGWLHVTTRNQAAQVVRTERRRQAREQEAHTMNEPTLSDPVTVDWAQLRPVIDGALDELEEHDREAVLLRYFEGRSYAEVGTRLRLTENAARMRVDRALEQMHGLLTRRGVTSPVGALALALSGEAAVTAPAGLAASVTGAALSGAVSASGVAGGMTLLAFVTTPKIVAAFSALVAALAMGIAYKQITENTRTKEDLLIARDVRTETLARAADEDTNALLAGIERVKAANEPPAKTPVTKETVQARFKRAQELVNAQKWEAALPELLWCYDEGMVQVDSGERPPTLLLLLGVAAKHYPPALAALQERRDRAVENMADTNDFRVAEEFAALNGKLGEDALTMMTFDKLSVGDPLRQGLVSKVYGQLVKAQRYAEIVSAMPYDQMRVAFAKFTSDLPASPDVSASMADTIKMMRRQMAIGFAGSNIEVLAGAGELDEARDLMGKLTTYDNSSKTAKLIRDHLTRAGHPELMPAAAK